MDTISTFFEERLMPIANRVGGNRTLTIIRDSMTVVIDLLIIGSISVLLTSFPVEAIARALTPAAPFFNALYNCTTGMMGVFVAASIAYYGARSYGIDVFSTALTSISAFLLTQISLDGTLDIAGLGSSGLITAMVVGFVSVGIISFFTKRDLVIKMPAGVPPAVAESFSALIPSTLILVLFGVVALILDIRINDVMSLVFSPLAAIVNTPWGYAIYHMLCGLVFFCGINSAVVIGVVQPFIMQMGAANEAAVLSGEPLPYCVSYATDTMIWAGGTGATIGLVLLMCLFAKSRAYRSLGRMSVLPGIFNINEPIIFGTPIAFNPIFLIPFVLLPGALAFATFGLTSLGMLARPVMGMVPWTLPPVAVSFFLGGGHVPTLVWGACVMALSIVCYYPFFRMADRHEYERELAAEAADTTEGGQDDDRAQ